MKSPMPDISDLFRLPYSKNDNPNGWIEITTFCNLKCQGCYRGCDREDNIAIHEPLEKIKETIREMKYLRNCQIISVSGGEPLLHPEIKEITRFIRDSRMIPFIHTNGKLLTPKLINTLRQNGLGGLIIRVDSLSRNRKNTEMELHEIRQKYGEMVAQIKGIHLTFLCVVNKENISEIGSIIDWSVKNHRLVDFVTFIPMRHILFDENQTIDNSKNVTLEDLTNEVAKHIPDIEYASFLNGTLSTRSIKWLQSPIVILDKKIIGYAGPSFVEFFQMSHHLLKGNYAYKFGKDRSYLNILQVLLLSLVFKNFRIIARRYTGSIIRNPLNLFRRATLQLLCFIIPPGVVNGKVEICEGCPDAILFNGELVPSCALEEIKKYGHLIPKE
jgi:MoaA/NifB/PqqE/SkfB family radical SAM enzyme